MNILITLAGVTKQDSQEIYAQNVLLELLPLLKEGKVYIVLSRSFPLTVFKNSSARLLVVPGLANKFFAAFFIQYVLPFYIFFLGVKKIYSPTPFFPLVNAGISFPTIHDLDYNEAHTKEKGLAVSFMRRQYTAAALSAKKCFVVSQEIGNEIQNVYGTTSTVVMHSAVPVVSNEYKNSKFILPTQPYFLYIGMYRERKNVETLIKAYGAVHETISEVLVLAGSVSSHKEVLLAIAAQYKCQDKIVFTGYVSDTQKQELYSHATAVVLPSLYEGFGFPILEAQTANTLIILSDIPVFHEIAGQGAVFFDPRNNESLAEVLHSTSTGQFSRNAIIEEGIKNLSRFSWKQTAKTIASTLQNND